SVKKPVARKSVAKKPTAKKPVAKKSAPKKAVAKKAAPQKAAPKKATPKKAAPAKTATKKPLGAKPAASEKKLLKKLPAKGREAVAIKQSAVGNSFGARQTLKVGKRSYTYYSLKAAEKNGLPGTERLPFSL